MQNKGVGFTIHQGSILGPWLVVTEAGFTPARFCDIAQPQPTQPMGLSIRFKL